MDNRADRGRGNKERLALVLFEHAHAIGITTLLGITAARAFCDSYSPSAIPLHLFFLMIWKVAIGKALQVDSK